MDWPVFAANSQGKIFVNYFFGGENIFLNKQIKYFMKNS